MDHLELSVTACIHLIINEPLKQIPISAGSGVFIKYKERFFICTAEHVASYKNCPVSILTGSIKDGQALLYEFGTFSFMRKFTLKEATKEALLSLLNNLENEEFEDIAFRETELLNNIKQPARKITLTNSQELNIKEGGKSIILADNNFTIDQTELYSFFGRTNTVINPDKKILDFKERLYSGLTIHEIMEDYIAFDLGMPIGSHDRFEGCSGAPIFDSQCRLVALLTHGDDDVSSSIVYGFRFDKTKDYIDLMYFSGIK